MRKRIVIVSPASARENNGNWQTASRWARCLRGAHDVQVARGWTEHDAAPALMVALHARRSAAALAAFTGAHPGRPSVLVLTGTDLYRDIHSDRDARASLERASALVLLQPAGLALLPAALRAKAHVIYQSAPSLRPWPRPASLRHADIALVGHLRDEKDPLTFIRAAALVTHPAARLVHIGGALDPELGRAADAAQATNSRYRWLGALPHAAARQRLKRCHAMAITSRMEGGANVIIEAVTSGVPVLASNIDGNRGMLDEDYAGYFAPGDAAALARLVDRCIGDAAFDALLRRQCAARATLFAPAAEQAALRDLVDNLLLAAPGAHPLTPGYPDEQA
ncbi:selenoneine biosynthesis selenosugar synthase SenB [Massilia yuzhufengensis]|uniref:Putative glycosyltransferase, TIGR04348 family n=1 Tax=Massilia yuzhufengensis TaxID=1164594 RepID=A0A1I1ER09_9BURK|nr:selenoneine biosynthesis selenosugar synthase SenB [Massilia yuzhufengensis]SFB87360.1 putative glycosyltransferase, TIGR04348 family [Massilia yuzhufengensis]